MYFLTVMNMTDTANNIAYQMVDRKKNEYKNRYNEQVVELVEKDMKLEEANAKIKLMTTSELKEFQS